MSQICRPNSDVGQDGNWVCMPVGGGWYSVIDEAIFNDADYVWHSKVVTGQWFRVGLHAPAELPAKAHLGDVTIRWRAARVDGGKWVQIRCTFYAAGSNRGSSLVTLTDDWTIYEFVNQFLVSPDDYADLELRFYVEMVGGGGKAPGPAISWAEVEVPDAPVASDHIPQVQVVV